MESLLHISLCTLVSLTNVLQLCHCGAQRALELCTSQSQLFQVVLYPCGAVVFPKMTSSHKNSTTMARCVTHTQPIISSQEVGHLNQLKVCVCESSVNSCGYYLLPPTNQTSFPLRKSGWLPVAQQRKEKLALALKELKLLTLNNTFHICNILPSMPPI